jgi:predicted kinase
VEARPVLHLTVGLPGVGKTTLARRIEAETGALRLTPDEWMQPLFGDSDANGKRDVLEGRFIWLARQCLRGGLSVILDFGCWSPDERYAIRDVAAGVGASFRLHYLTALEAERRARAAARWRDDPSSTFELSAADHDRFVRSFAAPTDQELSADALPPPPAPYQSWSAWASGRWPTLPRFDLVG